MEREICVRVFCTKYLTENVTKYLCYFHQFSVQDNLHEHYCAFEQFFVVSGFFCVALIYFFFIIKREPLLSEILIEIEFEVAKQTKKVRVCFFQNIPPAATFYHRQGDI